MCVILAGGGREGVLWQLYVGGGGRGGEEEEDNQALVPPPCVPVVMATESLPLRAGEVPDYSGTSRGGRDYDIRPPSTINTTTPSPLTVQDLLPSPSTTTAHRILLFGLSANPPTGKTGHLGIVHYLSRLGKWDEVWVMPVYKHLHNKDSTLAPFDDRLEMCKINFHTRKSPRERLGSSSGGGGGEGGGGGLSSAGSSRATTPVDLERAEGGLPPARVRVVRVEEEVSK